MSAFVETGWRVRWWAFGVLGTLLFASTALAQDDEGEDEAETNLQSQSTRPAVITFPSQDDPEDPDGADPDGDDTENGQTVEDGDTTTNDARPPQDEPDGFRPPIIDPRPLVGAETEYPSHFEDDFDPYHPPPHLRVSIDFPDAELTDLVAWFSALTGQNFIIADNVHAGKRITIIGPSPVTFDEAYTAFMAALHMNGLTIVPYGSFYRIVPEESYEQATPPFTPLGRAPRDDRMITQIVPLDYVEASTIQELVNELKSANGRVLIYAATNTLIISETGTNMRRLLDLIATLDTPGGDNRFIYEVRYADAEELRNLLLEVFSEQQQTQQREEPQRRRRRRRDREEESSNASSSDSDDSSVSISQIVADTRTNKLIVVASPRSWEAIREMAISLDQPIEGEGQIHVHFLENANATELAGTLQGLTQSVQEQRGEESGSRRRRDRDEEESSSSSDSSAVTFTGEVSISADEATNSLVVVASLRDFLNLKNVIEQLDRRREQVYVEAVIMEITADSDSRIGIAVNGGALPSIDGEDVPVFGGTSVGGLSSIVLDPSSLMGLAVGLRGPEVEGAENLFGPGIGLPSFGAILQAVQTDNNVNVLSTPHILTTDNEEAQIIVGQNIPFVTGGTGNISSLLSQAGSVLGDNADDLTSGLSGLTGLGSLGMPSFNVQRESVSLELTIRPQINESNFVRLEIEERVEDIISIDPVMGPSTSNREARTVVVVEDQQTVVIGGLIQDSVTETVSKVPVLGDIPIIGTLFRHTTTRTVKRNLLLLLTPYIIRDSSDFHEIFRRKMQERQEFLEFFGREELDYIADVDYARKNGPLQSMHETISVAVENEAARRRASGLHDSPQLSPTLQRRGDGEGLGDDDSRDDE